MMIEPSGNQCGFSGLASLSRKTDSDGKPGVSRGKSRFWHPRHEGSSVSVKCMHSARR